MDQASPIHILINAEVAAGLFISLQQTATCPNMLEVEK